MELEREEEEEEAQKDKEREDIMAMYSDCQAGCTTSVAQDGFLYLGDGRYRPPTEFKLSSLLHSRKKF